MRTKMTRGTSLLVLLVGLCLATPGFGQFLIEGTEELEFDRTEAWAMKWVTSLSLATGLGLPPELEAGSYEIGFEGELIPQLTPQERLVGFNGTKLEDLNKTRFIGRPRLTVGLANNFSLGVGYIPPIDVGGVKANVLSLSLAKSVRLGDTVRLGVRGLGQFGNVKGDITCDADTVAAGVDPVRNPSECMAVSDDEYKQRVFGGEVSLGYSGVVEPYVSFGVNYMDLEFQTNALYADLDDRTLLLTSGTTFHLTGGVRLQMTQSVYATGEIFYTPLSVARPPEFASQTESLVHARFALIVRLR